LKSIPDIYRLPYGIPLYWMDEQTGVLEKAVRSYHGFLLGEAAEPDEKTVSLLVEYLDHFIFAPCWTMTCSEAFAAELEALRRTVKMIKTTAGIREWNRAAMEIGLDPF
jgi:hypothetical protein